jgi:2-dehydro-3-deoxyglucarate aldolase
MNNLKKKIKRGELLVGGWITLYHPAIAEIFADMDFDWIVVDLEHSVITIREAEELIRIIELKGVSPLVRLSSIDAVEMKRVMDAGAHGVIAPMVKSVNEIENINKRLLYPPKGIRGVGLARAQQYGENFDEYINKFNDEAVVIPQIEHIDSVRNIEKILSHESVDAFLLGPYDLTASMGIPGEFEHKDYKEAINKVISAGNRFGKSCGIHIIEPDSVVLKNRIKDGFKFVAFSLDIRILNSVLRESLSEIRKK